MKATCIYCGREFDVSYARRSLGKRFGAGTYDDYCPDANECEDCLYPEISADYNEGARVIQLMGPGWDYD